MVGASQPSCSQRLCHRGMRPRAEAFFDLPAGRQAPPDLLQLGRAEHRVLLGSAQRDQRIGLVRFSQASAAFRSVPQLLLLPLKGECL